MPDLPPGLSEDGLEFLVMFLGFLSATAESDVNELHRIAPFQKNTLRRCERGHTERGLRSDPVSSLTEFTVKDSTTVTYGTCQGVV